MKDVKCLAFYVADGKCLFTHLQYLEIHFFYLSYVDAQRTPVLVYAHLRNEENRQA